jgi:hypothetical protein
MLVFKCGRCGRSRRREAESCVTLEYILLPLLVGVPDHEMLG